MIEQWQPASSSSSGPDASTLGRLISVIPAELSAGLQLTQNQQDASDLQQAKLWTQLDESQWANVWSQLSLQQVWQVAVWYVCAEQQFDGWHCGNRNPAIWAFRWLKQQGQAASKDSIRTIKSMTSNRFIPYGSVL
ncbi:hypothetical protein [Oceanobacter mangrovi]|uniref:hypothetical protein n=1 Tax=Oceanobacter mangrovi TaxID=2862510 RepID=UPI001C8D0CC1|nr:hypothetical protein [Oceanobacter mangrovi]